jgi:hypothetical protein
MYLCTKLPYPSSSRKVTKRLGAHNVGLSLKRGFGGCSLGAFGGSFGRTIGGREGWYILAVIAVL